MNAAVYVDFENLYLSLKTRNEGTGLRTRELGLQILEGLLARLRERGHPMTLGRSYAAFDSYPGVEVAHDLALMGLDPQYVLVSHSGKNSADIQLALDVSRVVYRRSDIELIVIVSGDRDFIPLARQVLEEGRELRVVAIPDTTSGDLRARVGDRRFWNALSLLDGRIELPGMLQLTTDAAAVSDADRGEQTDGTATEAADGTIPAGDAVGTVRTNGEVGAGANGSSHDAVDADAVAERPTAVDDGARIVGHIPVTWKTQSDETPEEHERLLGECLELMIRARLRHSSKDVWLSPFLRGPMSQHFSHLVHPERRALINELRNRGIIRVEERDNAYADHPYSVIVIEDEHPLTQSVAARVQRR